MRIEVESNAVTKRQISYADKRTGELKTIHVSEQKALLWRDGERYPERMILDVEEGNQPFAVGVYVLSDQSFVLNRYSKLSLRPELIKAEPPKATA